MFVRGTRGWSVAIGFVGLTWPLTLATVGCERIVGPGRRGNEFFRVRAFAILVIFQAGNTAYVVRGEVLRCFMTRRARREHRGPHPGGGNGFPGCIVGALLWWNRPSAPGRPSSRANVGSCEASREMLEEHFLPEQRDSRRRRHHARRVRIAYAACIFSVDATAGCLNRVCWARGTARRLA